MSSLVHAVTRATVWAAGVFYRVERVGAKLPDGPVLIVTNHPNMLMDPLVAIRVAGRRVRVMAKAPLFRIPIFGSVLRGLDALALYRRQDEPAQLHRNRAAFQGAVDALCAGETVLMFPEGRSHSEPALVPLKSGAARMALAAEEQSGWRLGLAIVPTGLTYERKHRFRSRVVAWVGDPIAVGRWRESYEADRAAAIDSLTRAVAQALRRQTLNVSADRERDVVETAEMLYARARGWAGWRAREPLQVRLPRLQRFAERFARLREQRPEEYDRLTRSLLDYRRQLAILGSRDADVPPRYVLRGIVRRAVREAALLGLALPLAALGTIMWYLPSAASALASRVMKPERETVATVKLLAGVLLYPATYVAWVAAAAWTGGPLAATLTALALPPLGFVAMHWQHRRREVWEDAKLFFRLVHRPGVRHRVAELREALAAELDALATDREAERSPREPDRRLAT